MALVLGAQVKNSTRSSVNRHFGQQVGWVLSQKDILTYPEHSERFFLLISSFHVQFCNLLVCMKIPFQIQFVATSFVLHNSQLNVEIDTAILMYIPQVFPLFFFLLIFTGVHIF